MNTSAPKQPDVEVAAAAREQWQRPIFKKTDAKDAEAAGPGTVDAAVFS